MNLNDHQKWLVDFYRQRGWYQYSTPIRLNFLIEEVGELSQAIRTLEIGRDHPGEDRPAPQILQGNIIEELSDVLDQVLILSNKFQINPEDLLQSEIKLKRRFQLPQK